MTKFYLSLQKNPWKEFFNHSDQLMHQQKHLTEFGSRFILKFSKKNLNEISMISMVIKNWIEFSFSSFLFSSSSHEQTWKQTWFLLWFSFQIIFFNNNILVKMDQDLFLQVCLVVENFILQFFFFFFQDSFQKLNENKSVFYFIFFPCSFFATESLFYWKYSSLFYYRFICSISCFCSKRLIRILFLLYL